MPIKKPMKKHNKWPMICLYISVALILFAIGLYIYWCQSLKAEFGYAKDFYGDTFDELFRLGSMDSDISDPIMEDGKNALTFIGADADCDDFEALSRYCVRLSDFPEAASCSYTLDLIASGMKKTYGYLWVAYTQRAYDANGILLTASGTEDERILSRWKIEKIDGDWTVTEIWEMP